MTDSFEKIDNSIKQVLAEQYSKHSFQPRTDLNGFARKGDGFSQESFIGPNAEFADRINYLPGTPMMEF